MRCATWWLTPAAKPHGQAQAHAHTQGIAARAASITAPIGVEAAIPAALAASRAAASPPAWGGDAARLLVALGGRDNVRSVETAASRLRVSVADEALIDRRTLATLGLRGVAVPHSGCLHLIVGPAAGATGAALQRLLEPAVPK